MTGKAMEKALTHYSMKMRNDKETTKVRDDDWRGDGVGFNPLFGKDAQ